MQSTTYEEERDVRWLNDQREKKNSIENGRTRVFHVRPLRGQCLIEILPPESVSSIVIPETAKLKDGDGKLSPVKGIVRRLGPWPQKKGGLCVLPEFVPGDMVLCNQYAGTKLRQLGARFRLVNVEDVLAKIDERR